MRIVIADTDSRVPLKDRILYKSDEFATNLDNEELLHTIALNDMLDAHNKIRAEVEWNASNTEGKTETRTGLQPLRIRDLVKRVHNVVDLY